MGKYDFYALDELYYGESKAKTILKLNKVFKLGYRPMRGYSNYSGKVYGVPTDWLINCFAHSCFNLTDNVLKDISFNIQDKECFCDVSTIYPSSYAEVNDQLVSFIKETGLEVESCDVKTKLDFSCEWKVALYFSELWQDFHFILQEKDGGWSSKQGVKPDVTKLETLPEIFDDYYELYDIKRIKNPYIKNEKDR